MAKSIRVSDGIYALAAAAGNAMNRSLADQIEHWARLGAALDAAGITLEQSLQMLGGDSTLRDRVLAHVTTARRSDQRRAHEGSASIAAKHAALEREVLAGSRTPESLFMLSRAQVKSATFVQREPAAAGTGW